MKGLKILVRGRVQGVNFRFNVKRFCDKSGISGRVRNLENGDVEIFALSSREKLKKLIEWIKLSPGFSKVEGIDVKEIEMEKIQGFEILREGGLARDKFRGIWRLRKRFFS